LQPAPARERLEETVEWYAIARTRSVQLSSRYCQIVTRLLFLAEGVRAKSPDESIAPIAATIMPHQKKPRPPSVHKKIDVFDFA